ncbi:MAG TPA: 1-phosphofructokinase family hexose kinase [Egibacteraceae bacterium]|nr:1-phosphofructokinase family hexose kinase [Egibacteraceae bacterium]
MVVVCPNTAVDRTVHVETLRVGAVERAYRAEVRAGGKGLNVARTLARLGVQAPVVGFVAGHTGVALRGLAADAGIELHAVLVDGETRSCVTVLAGDGAATVLNEPGPTVASGDWARLEAAVERLLAPGVILVVSGSLPAGSPPDGAARLVRGGHAHGATVVVDTSATALGEALAERPDLVAPNIEEARALLGGAAVEHVAVEDEAALPDAVAAARSLCGRGPAAALVTVGRHGAVLHARGASVHVRAPKVTPVNPVGAGDALVAGLVAGLASSSDLVDAVRAGVATATASVEAATAGDVDPDRARALGAQVEAVPVV